MKPTTVQEIAKAMRARIFCGSPAAEVGQVSTDSRTLVGGEVFFALRGENFDGHHFVREAVKKGASAVVVEGPIECEGHAAVLVVRSALAALGELAGVCRQSMSASVVAVTGSCGKTTVKEMIAKVLGGSFSVVRAPKSFNNAVGVPLTIFRAGGDTDVLVLEMGTSAPGEIRSLARIARPDVGIITNVGPAHLAGLKSIEGVAAAKAELLEGLAEGGLAVLNWDDRWIRRIAGWEDYKAVTFGRSRDADLQARNVRLTDQGAAFTVGHTDFALAVPGRHNVYNALAAIAVGMRFRMEPAEIARRLAAFELPALRMERRSVAGVEILADCYNANLLSVRAALEELTARPGGGRRIFVFGGMAELGERSKDLHERVGRLAARRRVDVLVTIGGEAGTSARAARNAGMKDHDVHALSDPAEAASLLGALLSRGDRVLFKASRGARLEELVRGVTSKLEHCEV